MMHRRDWPALQAQCDEGRLRKVGAVTGDDARLGLTTDHLAGQGIALSCLAVQGEYSGEQRGGQPQASDQRHALYRMPAPMAEQAAQGPVQHRHVIEPSR